MAHDEGDVGGLGVVRRMWGKRYTTAGIRIGLGTAVMAGICLTQLGPSETGADTTFVPGTASAGAQAISLSPTTGGLNYAIVLATSIAQFQNSQAGSLSQTIDLGTIGTALEAEGCNNSPPTIPKKDVPPPVQAESIDGAQTVSATITPDSTATGIGVGVETASVTTKPTGDSTTSVQAISLPGGLLSVSGLTSSAHVSLDNGNTRTATATSDIGAISIAHGVIVLGGLHWTATNISGASTVSTGTFSVGSLKVSGVTIPISPSTSPQSLLNIINTVGLPLGFNIQWPIQSTLADGTVQISPLIIGIDNNVLGQQVLGANLGKVQPVRQALVNAILNADCNLAAEITVSDIGVGVLAGGGNLNLSLGGAHAITTDAATVSPFSTDSSTVGGSALPTDTSGVSDLGSSAFTPGTPAIAGTTGTTAPTGTGTGAKTALGPIQKTTSCVSLGPSGGGCFKSNMAVPIGLIGLALVFALFVWDYLRQRRRAQMTREVLA